MSNRTRRLSAFLGGMLLACVTLPAIADDTEIYVSVNEADDARPNVLLILDTSGSMDTQVNTAPLYDPNTVYDSAGCDADRIYFSTTNTPPACNTVNWFPRASNICATSGATLANIGGGGIWPAFANSRARAAQYRGSRWQTIAAGNAGNVECEADNDLSLSWSTIDQLVVCIEVHFMNVYVHTIGI